MCGSFFFVTGTTSHLFNHKHNSLLARENRAVFTFYLCLLLHMRRFFNLKIKEQGKGLLPQTL